jgi:hypothetical protein
MWWDNMHFEEAAGINLGRSALRDRHEKKKMAG